MQGELSNFQRRLERCAVDCQDKIRDKVGPNTPSEQLDQFRGQYEDCVTKCVDTHLHQLPNLTKKMTEALKSRNYQSNYL